MYTSTLLLTLLYERYQICTYKIVFQLYWAYGFLPVLLLLINYFKGKLLSVIIQRTAEFIEIVLSPNIPWTTNLKMSVKSCLMYKGRENSFLRNSLKRIVNWAYQHCTWPVTHSYPFNQTMIFLTTQPKIFLWKGTFFQ